MNVQYLNLEPGRWSASHPAQASTCIHRKTIRFHRATPHSRSGTDDRAVSTVGHGLQEYRCDDEEHGWLVKWLELGGVQYRMGSTDGGYSHRSPRAASCALPAVEMEPSPCSTTAVVRGKSACESPRERRSIARPHDPWLDRNLIETQAVGPVRTARRATVHTRINGCTRLPSSSVELWP